MPGAQNGLTVMMAVDDISSGSPTVEVDGAAAINMRLTGSFTGGNLDFPGIDTDFHVNWAFSSSNPDLNPPTVSFDNVYLNLGHFISDLLTPVLEEAVAGRLERSGCSVLCSTARMDWLSVAVTSISSWARD